MNSDVSYLTTREVADMVRVTPSTVRRWAERGNLGFAAKLPGGEYRFDAAVVRALFANTSPSPESPAPVDSPLTRESAGAFSRSAGDAA